VEGEMIVSQYISWFTAVLVLYVAIKRICENKRQRYFVYPVVFLMVHVFIFYLYTFLRCRGYVPSIGISATWSAAIRLQSTLTFLLYQITSLKHDRLVKEELNIRDDINREEPWTRD
jgi:hypothetical protein